MHSDDYHVGNYKGQLYLLLFVILCLLYQFISMTYNSMPFLYGCWNEYCSVSFISPHPGNCYSTMLLAVYLTINIDVYLCD